MDEIKLVEASFQLIRKDLGLEEVKIPVGDNPPFERLHTFLEIRIRHMLDHNFTGLLHAMYRIDIPEQQVKELLELSEPEQIASNLAHAVIDREKQKVITRHLYRPS